MENLDPIKVRRYGTGTTTVVVLHGGPGAPGSASELARALAVANFEVLEPLQRRSGVVPLTVSRHVEDLAMVAPNPAVLIGWSWGAMLGLSFAARFPGRVTDLVLVGCGTYDARSRELLHRSVEAQLGATGLQKVNDLKNRLTDESDPAVRDAVLAQLGAIYMDAEGYDLLDTGSAADSLPPDEIGHNETWNDVLRLQRENIEPTAFSAISARVMLIHGDVDPHPGPATRDTLRKFIPTLEYISLDRCGHEPWRERHARDHFVEAIHQWLHAG